jgi:hypothetical protein
MNDDRDNNYVSVGSWMWMMFVTAIPVIGLIMMIIWAMTGENESRKNYFRAIFAWILVFVGIVMLLAFLGNAPVLKQIQSWTHRS